MDLEMRGLLKCQTVNLLVVTRDTPKELENRVQNANLLRLVQQYRIHGHKAALVP